MICYRDMTFCKFYKECVNGTGCVRALTDGVRKIAKQRELPISQFANKPECFKEKANESKPE